MPIGKSIAKKTAAIACAAAVLISVFSGCKSSGQAGNSAQKGASQHISLKILCPNYQDTSGIAKGQVFQQLETLSNATINMEWSPAASYPDKFNVLMASNNLPDVVIVPDLKSAVFTDAVAGNQFWQLDSYLSSSEFSNFKYINKTALNNTKTNGKSYVFPRERILKRQIVVYRADWAKKAGLGVPDTVQKVYDMAKTFGNGDFDGDGKKDTLGLLLSCSSDGGGQQIGGLNTLVVANGGYNNWGVKNGKVTSQYDTQQYMDTLTLLRQMHSEGLVSSDLPITSSSDSFDRYITTEKCGLYLSTGIPSSKDTAFLSKQKADPSLKLADIYGYTYLKDKDGSPRIPAETGFNGGIAFPKSATKNTARLKQLLGFFNVIESKEGQILINNGVENREFKINTDGSCTTIDANLLKTEIGDLNQLGISGNFSHTIADNDLALKLAKDRTTYKSSDLINDVSIPLSSQTYSNNVSTLNKIIDTAQFKYILGQESLDQFKAEIKNWKTSGGDKVASEYTASYNKSKSAKSGK